MIFRIDSNYLRTIFRYKNTSYFQIIRAGYRLNTKFTKCYAINTTLPSECPIILVLPNSISIEICFVTMVVSTEGSTDRICSVSGYRTISALQTHRILWSPKIIRAIRKMCERSLSGAVTFGQGLSKWIINAVGFVLTKCGRFI